MKENFLIIGLGNPGREYSATRHNIGFRILDRLAETMNTGFTRLQNDSFVAAVSLPENKILLAKPQTYMNLSGRSVSGLVHFYQIPLSNLLVCCDDIDLGFGQLRLRASGGSAGQRGMQSILDSLSTKAVPRLRFGIGRPPGRMNPADYVLRRFNDDELEMLPVLVDTAAKSARMFIDSGLESAMNAYNGGASDPSG